MNCKHQDEVILSHLPAICCANLYKILSLSESYSPPLGMKEFRETSPCTTFYKPTVTGGLGEAVNVPYLCTYQALLNPLTPSNYLSVYKVLNFTFKVQIHHSFSRMSGGTYFIRDSVEGTKPYKPWVLRSSCSHSIGRR